MLTIKKDQILCLSYFNVNPAFTKPAHPKNKRSSLKSANAVQFSSKIARVANSYLGGLLRKCKSLTPQESQAPFSAQ